MIETESTNESVSLAASFVAQNILQGVSRPADDFFPAWYWNVSNHFFFAFMLNFTHTFTAFYCVGG
jgi:hypothetical protein